MEIGNKIERLEELKFDYEEKLSDLVFYRDECLKPSQIKLSDQIYNYIDYITSVISFIDNKINELKKEYENVYGKNYQKEKAPVKTLFDSNRRNLKKKKQLS